MAPRESLRLAAFGIALALPASAVAAQLTDKNSVTPAYAIKEFVTFKGTGCNVAKQASVPFEPGASAVRAVAPKVGDREGDLRITAVSVGAAAVTFTAVADGAQVCRPDDGSPPAEREWSETFNAEVRLSRRMQTRYRLEFHVRAVKTEVKPRKIKLPGLGTISGIKWKSFGGRKAAGTGRLKMPPQNRCNPTKCPGHKGRFRVTLSKPSFCADISPKVQYGSMTWRPLRRMGRIRAGGLYVQKKSDCSLSKLKTVPR